MFYRRGKSVLSQAFPTGVGVEDLLRDHILKIGKKWGPITQAVTQGIFLRTVSREISAGDTLPYFNAEMRSLRCPEGHVFHFALLGRWIYYLVWRIHMICLTFFQESSRAEAGAFFSGPADWHEPEQVEQLKLALRMYSDEAFLSNEGFGDIYRWSREAHSNLAFQQVAVSELALLFILHHEVQHSMEAFHELNPDMPPVVRIGRKIEELGKKQQKNWVSEMQADCNVWFILISSVTSTLQEKTSMPEEEARIAEHSMSAQGPDVVLHSLEFVERQTYGRIDVETARPMLAFLTHPTCDLRRKALSYTSYQQVTGLPYAKLFEGHSTVEWQRIAQYCGSQIAIRERLYSAAEASR